MTDESISTAIGQAKYAEFNRQACLNGVALDKVTQDFQRYQVGEITKNQFRGSALIAYNIHSDELRESLRTAFLEQHKIKNLRVAVSQYIRMHNPANWDVEYMTDVEMEGQATDLLSVFSRAIEIAKQKGT